VNVWQWYNMFSDNSCGLLHLSQGVSRSTSHPCSFRHCAHLPHIPKYAGKRKKKKWYCFCCITNRPSLVWHWVVVWQEIHLPSKDTSLLFFWYSAVVAGQWLPSLRHITDICLQLVSVLFRIPRICCSLAVVSFSLSYISWSSCLLEHLTSRNNTSCRRTCPSHLRFRWFIVLMIQRFSWTRFRTSELLTFAVQKILPQQFPKIYFGIRLYLQ